MILVAGGSGRLGRLVVGELAQQHDVRVLARRATTAALPMGVRVSSLDADVRDASAVATAARGVACIVIASHGVESRERDGLASVDIDGARAVVAAARQVGCAVVLTSIVGAASDATLPIARSKWAAERIVSESGVPWTIVRSAAFAQTWAMILTMSAGRSGRPSMIGRGRAGHRFVDVRDVAAVVARAATDEGLRGRTLQVSGPDVLTPSQLAAMVQQANAWSGQPRHLPLPVARAIGAGLAPFRPDLARRVALGIAMEEPQPPDGPEVEVPEWLSMRRITPETMRWSPEVEAAPAR
ncbi:SDR family oxidoreductase [Agrococcus sp. DT81.2]|uniref:SDR family oxidoreductase n=1 Tax=Agrococcus sp. DT81.2 TaxID=3393414 RepID=UPI003CE58670